MHYAHGLGIRVMLSEFSPLPGSPDGEMCRRWIDLDEPLRHNKTAFVIDRLGIAEINRLKTLASRLNQRVEAAANRALPDQATASAPSGITEAGF